MMNRLRNRLQKLETMAAERCSSRDCGNVLSILQFIESRPDLRHALNQHLHCIYRRTVCNDATMAGKLDFEIGALIEGALKDAGFAKKIAEVGQVSAE